MATATNPAPPPLTSPAVEPLSDDDASSPLSDVEDKDGEVESMDHLIGSHPPDRDEDGSDDELSDANDTEAETERLNETPQTATRQKDVVLDRNADDQVFERTPSKLRQVNNGRARTVDDDDDEPLSDGPSMASSPPAQALKGSEKLGSPPTLDLLAEIANQEAESRKRKRSSMPVDRSESDQPHRKRTGSVSAADVDGDTAMADDDEPSTNTNSGEHSADEAINVAAPEPDAEAQAEETPVREETRFRKHTRSGSRKLREAEIAKELEEPVDEPQEATAEEDGAHTGDDEHMELDVDEAETAQKNEEELERKKSAYDQLSQIEKRFATFRDRLYEERIAQLDKEEAMLRADNPTHPEYLSMMMCVDARRDERVRFAQREFQLNFESLERWAVARRAQAHSQYFQSIRETREAVLADLGQQWYEIQNERRKHAENVPDFGIRFPHSHTQRVRDAMAYNKEVSILSGIAKYEGMPAAPDMRGASAQELEDDFEAMRRDRNQLSQTNHQPTPRAAYGEYTGLPFGATSIGPAGEQFLEQTPWANPQHPAHTHSRQPQAPPPKTSPGAGPSEPRRSNVFSSSTISNSSNPAHPSQPSNGHAHQPKGLLRNESASPEVTRAASLLEQTSARSLKAAAAVDMKHEAAPPVGGL